ncbi:hypothetical protein AgCh_008516 [Apium graveolens]
MKKVEDVVIVGGGICGLATAVALKRVGIDAVVLERAETLRTTGTSITLASNAWLALDALGVSHKLSRLYSPLTRSTVINVSNGAVQQISFPQADKGRQVAPKAVHRKALMQALAEELPIKNIHFSCKITSISTELDIQGSSIAVLLMEDGTYIKTKVLIGCDGVHSRVARWLGLGEPVNSGRSAVRGLSIFPQGHQYDHDFTRFVDVSFNGAFVPLTDTELFWGLVIGNSAPLEHRDIAATTPAESIQRDIKEHHCKDFPKVYLDVVSHLDLSTLTWGPLKLRLPWNVIFGNLNKGTITVAGDAMHPMTPDLGQGGCSALEDAVVLGRCIGESYLKNERQLVSSEVAKAIDDYVKERRWRVAGLIAASFVSGWMQDGSSWLKRFIRNAIFYRIFRQYFSNITNYDCGKLPKISSCSPESNSRNKID